MTRTTLTHFHRRSRLKASTLFHLASRTLGEEEKDDNAHDHTQPVLRKSRAWGMTAFPPPVWKADEGDLDHTLLLIKKRRVEVMAIFPPSF